MKNPTATGGGNYVTATGLSRLDRLGSPSLEEPSRPIHEIRIPQGKVFRGLRPAAQFSRYLANAKSIALIQEAALAAIDAKNDDRFFHLVNDFNRFEKYVIEGLS